MLTVNSSNRAKYVKFLCQKVESTRNGKLWQLSGRFQTLILRPGETGQNLESPGLYGRQPCYVHVGIMSLKVYILPTLKLIFVQAVLNTVSSISNVHSLYQCSCKQCCAIAVYAMCYSVINPCGYWTSGTLSALASNGNTLYNVMGVKRQLLRHLIFLKVRVSVELR